VGNWRTLTIVGHIDAPDAPAAVAFVELGPDPANWGEFHCLCYTGMSLCGLGRWVPGGGGRIFAVGNLAERDYGVEDVAEALRRMVAAAPSLDVKVHCGGEWEDPTCVATVTAHEGQVTVGPPEVERVGDGLQEQGVGRLDQILTTPRDPRGEIESD
jgi:hypothetical protein